MTCPLNLARPSHRTCSSPLNLGYSHLQWHKSVSAMIFDRYCATDILLTDENPPRRIRLIPLTRAFILTAASLRPIRLPMHFTFIVSIIISGLHHPLIARTSDKSRQPYPGACSVPAARRRLAPTSEHDFSPDAIRGLPYAAMVKPGHPLAFR